MKTSLVLLLVTFAGAFGASFLRVAEPIPDTYIVVFHKNVTNEAVHKHMASLTALLSREEGEIAASYHINDEFRGFSARLSERLLNKQLEAEIVNYVEQDQVVRLDAAAANCNWQFLPPWGIARVSGSARVAATDQGWDFKYNRNGNGVTAYVIDTGILLTHSEFTGRVTWGANFIDNINTDCNGHGTHVAGTIAGSTYGIAKKAQLVAVKVLNCTNSGTYAAVISGVNYVANQGKKPSVANMSLGGPRSTALNDAVTAAINSGISFVVAAGNDGTDACGTSPASTPTAISTGATEQNGFLFFKKDQIASFSNWGKCVSIFAPGVSILSAYIGSNTNSKSMPGTSMAAPHVTGAVAQYLSVYPTATPAEVKAHIVGAGLKNVIDFTKCSSTDCKNTSPNLLLQSPCTN